MYCTSSRVNSGRTPPRSTGSAWSTNVATLAALARTIAFSAADCDEFGDEDAEADDDGDDRGRASLLLHPATSAASATGITNHRTPRIPSPTVVIEPDWCQDARSPTASARPRQTASPVSTADMRILPQHRRHLNGLAMRDGSPAYVTVLAATDTPLGWRTSNDNCSC